MRSCAAAADFRNCLEGMWPEAARARHLARELRQAYRGARRPSCGSWTSSTRSRNSPRRSGTISTCWSPRSASRDGREMLAQHARLRCGGAGLRRRPPCHRGDLGHRDRNTARSIGERPVIRSTATLACVGRRQAYFRDEFLAALEILHRGDIAARASQGLVGRRVRPTQFMPTSFKRYAVDFDGDGRRDVVGSIPDVIASTANNLKKDGWVSRPDLGLRGRGAAGLQLHARRPLARADHARMGRLGVRRAARRAVPAPGRQGLSVGAGGRARAGVPDAGEFPRHHEIQPGRGLCAGDRPSRRPAARRRRRSCRPGRATSACCRAPSGSSCSSCSTATASTSASRTGGSATRPASRCAISRPERPRAGRLCLRGDSGPAARPLSLSAQPWTIFKLTFLPRLWPIGGVEPVFLGVGACMSGDDVDDTGSARDGPRSQSSASSRLRSWRFARSRCSACRRTGDRRALSVPGKPAAALPAAAAEMEPTG